MAFLLNFQSPKTLDDLLDRWEYDGLTNIDHILHFEDTIGQWTVDKDAKVGEKVFFSCAKTSIDHMNRLLSEIEEMDFLFDDDFIAFSRKKRELYQKYAGHIVAIGKVGSVPFESDSNYANPAWKSRWYADIVDFQVLATPIPFSAFTHFIQISRTGSRTKLTDAQCQSLMALVE